MNKSKLKKEDIELLSTTITDLVVRHTNPGLAESWPINSSLAELYGIVKLELPIYTRAETQFERETNRRTDQRLICLANDNIPVLTMQRNPNTITVLNPAKETKFYSSLLKKLREVEESFELKLLIEEDGEGSIQSTPVRIRGVTYTSWEERARGMVGCAPLSTQDMMRGHVSFELTTRSPFISIEDLRNMPS